MSSNFNKLEAITNSTEKEAFDYSREKILEGHNVSTFGEKHNSLYDARVIKAIDEILRSEDK